MKLGIADSKEIRGEKKEDKYYQQMALLGKAFDDRLFFEIEKKQVQANMKGWLRCQSQATLLIRITTMALACGFIMIDLDTSEKSYCASIDWLAYGALAI